MNENRDEIRDVEWYLLSQNLLRLEKWGLNGQVSE